MGRRETDCIDGTVAFTCDRLFILAIFVAISNTGEKSYLFLYAIVGRPFEVQRSRVSAKPESCPRRLSRDSAPSMASENPFKANCLQKK